MLADELAEILDAYHDKVYSLLRHYIGLGRPLLLLSAIELQIR